jgi:hypothetical protein
MNTTKSQKGRQRIKTMEVVITEEHKEREYVEIMTSLRHYSNLRFSVIAVFYGVTAALTVGAFGFPLIDGMKFGTILVLILKALGIFVTAILFSYEYMIDGYQVAFRKYLENVWPESHWFHRPHYSVFFQWPVSTLYVAMMVFWMASFLSDPTLRAILGRR